MKYLVATLIALYLVCPITNWAAEPPDFRELAFMKTSAIGTITNVYEDQAEPGKIGIVYSVGGQEFHARKSIQYKNIYSIGRQVHVDMYWTKVDSFDCWYLADVEIQ